MLSIVSQVLIWETRSPRGGTKQLSKKEREILNPMGVPLTFKHLDLVWKPFLRVENDSCLFLVLKRLRSLDLDRPAKS